MGLRGDLDLGILSPNTDSFGSGKQVLGEIAGYFEKNRHRQTPTQAPYSQVLVAR